VGLRGGLGFVTAVRKPPASYINVVGPSGFMTAASIKSWVR